MKREEINLEHLTDEQLDDFLDYTEFPFNEENLHNIRANFDAQTAKPQKVKFLKKRKRRRVWAGIVAAVAAITLFAGFSKADELRMLYLRNFGSGSTKLLANSDELSQEVTHDGIQLKALASFKDTKTTYFLSQLTDTTGNRLGADLNIYDWEMLSGGNTKVVDYDEATKTATLLTRAINLDGSGSNGFVLKSFLSHEHDFDEKIDVNLADSLKAEPTWIDLSDQESTGGGSDEKVLTKLGIDWEEISKTAMKPAEMNQMLLQERGVSISNIGYRDELLHLQIKSTNSVKEDALFVDLVNKTTGEKISSICDYQVDQGTHNNETGRSDYTEYVFNIPQNELANYQVQLSGWYYEDYVKGEWAIQLAEVQSLETKKLADTTVKMNDIAVQLKNIVLSPMSLSFDYQSSGDKLSLPFKMILKDGSVKEFNKSNLAIANEQVGDKQSYSYQFGYLDLEQVKAIEIAGETIAVK